jgi:hypothetical protein
MVNLIPHLIKWGFYFLFVFINYTLIMNNEQKAAAYNQLMMEYTRTQNKISSIKGESLNLNQNQINEIRELERRLNFIMQQASRL